jgi:hypothetical protein
MDFSSGIPMPLSAHQWQLQLAAYERLNPRCGDESSSQKARLQNNQGKSPFSVVACVALLLPAGILVKFAA